MKIRLRKTNEDGMIRLETSGTIEEIMINEDFLHPSKESIAICYRGRSSSGIVEMSPEEIEKLYDKIKTRIHLIKGFKRLSGSGARLL